jgi:hypothetical protein
MKRFVCGLHKRIQSWKHSVTLRYQAITIRVGSARLSRSRFSKMLSLLVTSHRTTPPHRTSKRTDPLQDEIDVFALERHRVSALPNGERNFHIFYQLLRGHVELSMLLLHNDPTQYAYLNTQNGANPHTVDSISDESDFVDVERAFAVFGFTEDHKQAIHRIVAAVLLLGNIQFRPSSVLESLEQVIVADTVLCQSPSSSAFQLTHCRRCTSAWSHRESAVTLSYIPFNQHRRQAHCKLDRRSVRHRWRLSSKVIAIVPAQRSLVQRLSRTSTVQQHVQLDRE